MALERMHPYRMLDDHYFQDWMAAVNLLKKEEKPVDEAEIEFDISQLPGMMRDVLETLNKERGYVVPGDRVPGGPVNNYRNEKLNELREMPGFPHVLRVPELGLAVGVDDFRLRPSALSMLYLASKNFCRLIPATDYADFIYGSHDEADLRATNHVMQRLQKRDLIDTTLTLDHIYLEGDDYLRLADTDILNCKLNKRRFKVDPDVPPHLQHPYQDWLVTDARLAERSIDPKWKLTPESIISDPAALSETSRAVIKKLIENTGYIVDRPSLAHAAFGNPLPSNWYNRLIGVSAELAEQLHPGIEINHFFNIGWSLGMEKLALPLRPLQTLYPLWNHYNVPYSYKELARDLYGRNTAQNINRAQDAVTKLSAHLRDSAYAVGSVYLFNTPKRTNAPILVKRSLIAA